MAYGNWGAKVWKDGVARHDRCDTHPNDAIGFDDSNLDICYYNLSGHAVVGDKDSRYVFSIYKNYIAGILYWEDNRYEHTPQFVMSEIPFEIREAQDTDVKQNGDFDIEYERYHKKIHIWRENWIIYIEFEGWKAECGQSIGEGFEEWE